MSFPAPIFGSDLPYSQRSDLNDIARQLEYEVYFCPNGFVATTIERWYNSLYSELFSEGCDTGDYGMCLNSSALSSSEVVNFMTEQASVDAINTVIEYMFQHMMSLSSKAQVELFVKQMKAAVDTALKQYEKPK